MPLTIYPVTADFAAEVGDVDLASADARAVEEIKAALWRYAVLIFPDQHLTPDQQLAFAGQIGPPDQSLRTPSPSTFRTRLDSGLVDVSNLTTDDQPWEEASHLQQLGEANKLWHSDSTFCFVPALASILYGKAIPPVGGITEFADERAAYDALPDETKHRLAPLLAEHSFFYSRMRCGLQEFPKELLELNPPVPQMLVRTLPETGRKTLYLAAHIGRILGMSKAESDALFDQLVAHSTQPPFVYRHRWRPNDVVMWDNRCTMHRQRAFEDTRWRRDMQRASVGDRGNTILQEGLPYPVEYRLPAQA